MYMFAAAELHDLSLACTRLWHLDSNRLEPDVDYKIDLQDGKHMWDHGDYATERLFTFVDPSVFERRTYKLFLELLDNYERGVRVLLLKKLSIASRMHLLTS